MEKYGLEEWHTLGLWTIALILIHIQHGSKELWLGHRFRVCVHCDLELRDMTVIWGHDTPFSHGQKLCEILSRSNKAVRSYGLDMDFWYVCTVTYFWDMTLIQGNDIPLNHGQELCIILSRSNMAVRSYGLDRFWVCLHCNLDLGDMTLNQGHDTPLDDGQQLCEILQVSRSNMEVRSYDPDTHFGYVCTVTLTLEKWTWFKVMTHPYIMDNNCVKYYPDRTRK